MSNVLKLYLGKGWGNAGLSIMLGKLLVAANISVLLPFELKPIPVKEIAVKSCSSLNESSLLESPLMQMNLVEKIRSNMVI